MKHTKTLSVLLLLGTFALLFSGCNMKEPVTSTDPFPQLIQGKGSAIYCRDCPGGCILAYDFTSSNIDGNHPQGGYRVEVLKGNCDCERTGVTYNAATTGPITILTGQIGGPASGSLPDPASQTQFLFGFHCLSNGGFSGGVTASNQSWTGFSHEVQNNYTGPLKPGVVNWPEDWNVFVTQASPSGNIKVDLPYSDQSQMLAEIHIHNDISEEPITTLTATGANEYTLDFSALPVGHYGVELEFSAGFSLWAPFYRYIPEN